MMAASSKKQLGVAFKELADGKFRKILLTGDRGVGKTWMARMLSDRAIRKGKFDIVLWLFQNREFRGSAFYETIARQLSLISVPNEYEAEDDDEKSTKGNEKEPTKGNEEEPTKGNEEEPTKGNEKEPTKGNEKEPTKGNEKESTKGKEVNLEVKIQEKLDGKKVLFIMDDHKGYDSEKGFEFTSEVESLLGNCKEKSWKILITAHEKINTDDPEVIEIEVKALSEEESWVLLRKFAEQSADNEVAETFLKKTPLLPADIIVLGKALKHFNKTESGQQRLEEIAKVLPASRTYNAMQLLLNGYKLLPSNVLFDWYRPGNKFLQHGNTLQYKELITYWILEGYLGTFDCIENAYEKGHSVLMELLECGLLKEQSDGYVMVNGSDLKLDPFRLCEFIGTIPLGLANVINDEYGRILETNGMVKIICNDEERKKASALLVDANHLSREISENSDAPMEAVESFAIFNPTYESLPHHLFKMHNCRLFVLRDCEYLKCINETLGSQNQHDDFDSKADHTHKLLNTYKSPGANTYAIPKVEISFQKLSVLEISGASCLMEIPKELFKNMLNLQSLNLSKLPIGSLPESFYDLRKLVWLILRGCSSLQKLKSLKNFDKLQVLDLSGATSFSSFDDRIFKNKELQTLDLSQSIIKKLPLLRDLQKLNHLLLKDCSELSRLPKISALVSLQILDISGSKNFKEFHDPSLEKLTELKLINISQTAVKKLPLHMSNPREFRLSGCTRLERLSFIESMKDLEMLDISSCSCLKKINENFFTELTGLREFNLSGTRVETLPPLSKLSNVRQLLSSSCASLTNLGDLTSLEKLEVLDLSGSTSLKEIQSLKGLKSLKKLDLSETQITSLPPLSDPSNLSELFLKNCTKLEELQSLGVLSKLEELHLSGASKLAEIGDGFFKDMTTLRILDLSETKIEKMSSLTDLTSICHLLLRKCAHLTEVLDLKKLTTLQVLDLSGTAIKELPDFEAFSHLQCLLLKDCTNLEKFKCVKILDLLENSREKLYEELPGKISVLGKFKVLELPKIESPADEPKESSNKPVDLQETESLVDKLKESPTDEPTDPQKSEPLAVEPEELKRFQVDEPKESLADEAKDSPSYKPKEYSWSISWPAPLASPAQPAPTPLTTKFSISMDHIQFLQLLEKNKSLQIRLSHFKLFVRHVEADARCEDKFCKNELFLREIIQTGQLSGKEEKQGSSQMQGAEDVHNQTQRASMEKKGFLDLRGFDHIPKGIKLVLSHATNVFLISNPFLTCITDFGDDNIKQIDVCWIEKCSNLESFLPTGSVENTATKVDDANGQSEVGKNEEDNADISDSKSIYSRGWQFKSFGNLRCLYLEHCPTLSYICHSSQQLENLVFLQIKYCQNLKALFVDDSANLPKLEKLQLWELPNLQNIMCKMSSLSTLRIGECPKLESIFRSPHFSKDLKVLEIRSCDKLKNVFEVFEGSEVELAKLESLRLWDLPELQKTGICLPESVTRQHSIRECPALEDPPAASLANNV